MDITRKTTGYLIGEFVTHSIKSKYAQTKEQREAAQQRLNLLIIAIGDRMTNADISSMNPELRKLIRRLEEACKICWDAQEVVMTSNDPQEVFVAAKITLAANKERNIQIRALDDLFSEKFFAVLEKSYVLE